MPLAGHEHEKYAENSELAPKSVFDFIKSDESDIFDKEKLKEFEYLLCLNMAPALIKKLNCFWKH